MPLITRPQVYRVVRELLPKERFGPEELLLWLTDVQERNERARCSHQKRRAALGRNTSGLPSMNRRCNTRNPARNSQSPETVNF